MRKASYSLLHHMNPVTHLFTGWAVANAAPLSRRQRSAVTLASVIPDIDGAGLIVDWATALGPHPTSLYAEYHHIVGHTLLASLAVGIGCLLIPGPRRALAFLLGLISFHLHLLGDLVGSRGPDGSQWEIVYLWPFSNLWQWRVHWQWELNAWPNVLVTVALLCTTFWLAWKRGFSIVEIVSERADAIFVATVRKRFPRRPTA